MQFRIVKITLRGLIQYYEVEQWNEGFAREADYWELVFTTSDYDKAVEFIEGEATPVRTVIKTFEH